MKSEARNSKYETNPKFKWPKLVLNFFKVFPPAISKEGVGDYERNWVDEKIDLPIHIDYDNHPLLRFPIMGWGNQAMCRLWDGCIKISSYKICGDDDGG